MAQRSSIIIGTRGSPLALAQAYEARDLLSLALGWSREQLPLNIIKTTGDIIQDRSLAEAGGKGLFTRELDQALLNGEIDLAVHSAKDLPTDFPDGIECPGYLKREDVRDALISLKYNSLDEIPADARIGTASFRRQCQMKQLFPHAQIQLLRGNVDTRLKRLAEESIDVTLLAVAGLNRLGYQRHIKQILETDSFLPAVGQGAIGLTIRNGDPFLKDIASRITDGPTSAAVTMERAFLKALDGSCRMPIAGYAREQDSVLSFKGQVFRPDGSEVLSIEKLSSAANAFEAGLEAGLALKKQMPEDYFG